MPVTVEIFGRSDVGVVRETNEDSFAIGDLDRGTLWDGETTMQLEIAERGPLLLVCDGMGGAHGGEVASELAARVVWEEMRAQGVDAADHAVYARLLRRAVRVANRRVFEEGRREVTLRGMGTTLSAAGFAGGWLVIAQVGDSRVYVHRGTTLAQVTRDQSIVSALVHAGRITEEEARRSLHANMILQALGVAQDLEVSLSVVELRRGDHVLLCSDGLHGPVGDIGITGAFVANKDLRAIAAHLLDAAADAGGPDNATVVVARFDGDGLSPPASEDELPRFAEFDPGEEGARALTSTSFVARRLAARAGLVDDPGPPPIPATGQHTAIRASGVHRRRDADGDLEGPANAALAEGARLGPWSWAVIIVMVGAAIALAVFGAL